MRQICHLRFLNILMGFELTFPIKSTWADLENFVFLHVQKTKMAYNVKSYQKPLYCSGMRIKINVTLKFNSVTSVFVAFNPALARSIICLCRATLIHSKGRRHKAGTEEQNL